MITITIEHINRPELLRYLGYGKSQADEKTNQLIDECEKQIIKVIEPRYTYKCFNIVSSDNNIHLKNTTLILKGKDIKNHLEGCTKCILMCATISSKVDMLIRKTQLSDMAKALIFDTMASVAIEQVCNNVDKIIKNEFSDYYMTWRFSPGYGDFPIEIQNAFLDTLFAQKKIGLTATGNSILLPRKSVTAVIGISKNPVSKKRRGCASCNLRETCEYRKRGEHCEF